MRGLDPFTDIMHRKKYRGKSSKLLRVRMFRKKNEEKTNLTGPNSYTAGKDALARIRENKVRENKSIEAINSIPKYLHMYAN